MNCIATLCADGFKTIRGRLSVHPQVLRRPQLNESSWFDEVVPIGRANTGPHQVWFAAILDLLIQNNMINTSDNCPVSNTVQTC